MSAFTVYIIYSLSRDQYYVGSCDDIERRLSDHNSGRSRFTRTGKPWVLKYQETLASRSLARKRELEIKKKKSRRYLEWLISSAR